MQNNNENNVENVENKGGQGGNLLRHLIAYQQAHMQQLQDQISKLTNEYKTVHEQYKQNIQTLKEEEKNNA